MVFVFKLEDGRTVEADSLLLHGEQVCANEVMSVKVTEGPTDADRAEVAAAVPEGDLEPRPPTDPPGGGVAIALEPESGVM